MDYFVPPSFNWQRDLPDARDYLPDHAIVTGLLKPLKPARAPRSRPVPKVDLREYFPPIRDQQGLKSSAAHAAVSLLEYFLRRAKGRMTPGSVRFVYKMARKLLHCRGDTGANPRTALKALVRFGVPPEEYFPYDVQRFDEEPDTFLYCFPNECAAVTYLRLDAANASGRQTLRLVKAFLAAGFPSLFGFSLPRSLTRDADIPWRPTIDSIIGGQTVVAAGYDDSRIRSTKGAILFHNCWGTDWGEGGYGWLPYRLVEQQLAGDFWTIVHPEWLDPSEFCRPSVGQTTRRAARKKRGAGGSR